MLNPLSAWLCGEVTRRLLLIREKTAAHPHPAGAPASPGAGPRRPGANRRLFPVTALELPLGNAMRCGARLQPPRVRQRCEPRRPLRAAGARLPPLRARLNPPATSLPGRYLSRCSLRSFVPSPISLFGFFSPSFPPPPVPALLPHPLRNCTAFPASFPPRSPQRSPLLRAPPPPRPALYPV